MTDADLRAADALLDTALGLPPSERTAFLDAHVPPALLGRVERLLAAAEADDPLLDGAPVSAAEARAAAAAPTGVGERVGPYRLAGLLGEGGMGRVYRAERADGAFERTVALKVVRRTLALAGVDVAGRLRRERAVLAGLEHPNIARLYGGGETDDGVPWVAMELVEGAPITAFAEDRGLTVRERVSLAVDVCRAVEHAHRRLVVHRDLKPSNVFVAEGADGGPVVKLLDFGIARLLDGADGALTGTGAPLLTPAYAAPEQLADGEVTTATDVWALGALAYELLTGRRPYPEPTGPSGPLARLRVREETLRHPPPSPSQAAGGARGRALRGDLDAVVLKALRAEPEGRYASAGALADDLGRVLDGLPVVARRASGWYLARSFVRRHRGAVAATLAVALALVGGLATALLSLDREREARATAEAEAARADGAFAFVVDLFGGTDGGRLGGGTTTGELLAAGERRARRLPLGPERAIAFAALRDVRLRLDERAAARAAAAEASRAARRTYGPRHPYTLDALATEAMIAALSEDADAALSAWAEAEAGYRALGPAGRLDLARHRAVFGANASWAAYHGDDPATWGGPSHRALAAAEPVLRGAADSTHLVALLNGQAHLAELQDGVQASLPYFAEAYRIVRALHGDGRETLSALNNLGDTYLIAGRAGEAVPYLDSLVTRSRRALGPSHPSLGLALVNAASARLERGRVGDLEQALAWTSDADRIDLPVASWRGSTAVVRMAALRAARRWEDVLARAAEALADPDAPDAHAAAHAEIALARAALGQAAARRAAAEALRADDDEAAVLAHLALACVASTRDSRGAAMDSARQAFRRTGLPAHYQTGRLVRDGPAGLGCAPPRG